MTSSELLCEALMSDSVEVPVNLAELLHPPAWHADAACKEHPSVSFFPELGETTTAAKGVCAGCLVVAECGAYAVEQGIEHGIWGGLAPRARQALRAA